MTGRAPVTAAPLARLIDAFHRLPGIGPKSAQRLAYHVLRAPRDEAEALAAALLEVKDRIQLCAVCQNVTEQDPCPICADSTRAAATVCVVEEPLDILALERAGGFDGRYHVLHGVLSPMDGIGPEQLKIRELLQRLQSPDITEVILATNPNLEGEATAAYLARVIQPLGVRVTRLAHGLPVGGDLEYADERTLSRALQHRVALDDDSGRPEDPAVPPEPADESKPVLSEVEGPVLSEAEPSRRGANGPEGANAPPAQADPPTDPARSQSLHRDPPPRTARARGIGGVEPPRSQQQPPTPD